MWPKHHSAGGRAHASTRGRSVVSPPPQPYLEIRTRDGEQGYDPDCQLVSYAACKNAVADYAAANEGVLNVLRAEYLWRSNYDISLFAATWPFQSLGGAPVRL